MKRLLLLLSIVLVAALPAREPVVDTYFQTSVVDRFRWMENLADPAVQSWVRERNGGSAARLGGQLNSAFRRRVAELDGLGIWMPTLAYAGHRFFELRADRGHDVPQLFVRDEKRGNLRLLGAIRASHGFHEAIDYIAPSPGGDFVAYGLSRGGSEDSALHVVRVADGAQLGTPTPHARFANVSWLPDSSGFFYGRLIDAKTIGRSRVYLHRLGSRGPDK